MKTDLLCHSGRAGNLPWDIYKCSQLFTPIAKGYEIEADYFRDHSMKTIQQNLIEKQGIPDDKLALKITPAI